MLIVTNNPKVIVTNYQSIALLPVEGEYQDVLLKVKELIIDKKYRLLSHPLSGSIKPNETYYKSIMLDDKSYEYSDLESLEMIEAALAVYDKFIGGKLRPNWTQKVLDDFALVDYFLIQSAVQSANCL